jgi:pyrroloquinoline quinone (PQQ) biosynthesis protein C|tara:strand:+ start:359 stop:640 length:282 start_codon:yes stop_codon:yes gene_type:complete
MSNVTGKDMVDMMAEGVNTYVKEHLLKSIVKDLVDEFEKDITTVVSDKLAGMFFKARKECDHRHFKEDLHILIEWAKTQEAYKTKYTMQSEQF